MEAETDNSITFLDITIQKESNKFSFNIYRKPTTTDTIIPRESCHPPEQKHAAIRYMINRMNTYQLNDCNKVIYQTSEQFQSPDRADTLVATYSSLVCHYHSLKSVLLQDFENFLPFEDFFQWYSPSLCSYIQMV
jgi:hypothetical protein